MKKAGVFVSILLLTTCVVTTEKEEVEEKKTRRLCRWTFESRCEKAANATRYSSTKAACQLVECVTSQPADCQRQHQPNCRPAAAPALCSIADCRRLFAAANQSSTTRRPVDQGNNNSDLVTRREEEEDSMLICRWRRTSRCQRRANAALDTLERDGVEAACQLVQCAQVEHETRPGRCSVVNGSCQPQDDGRCNYDQCVSLFPTTTMQPATYLSSSSTLAKAVTSVQPLTNASTTSSTGTKETTKAATRSASVSTTTTESTASTISRTSATLKEAAAITTTTTTTTTTADGHMTSVWTTWLPKHEEGTESTRVIGTTETREASGPPVTSPRTSTGPLTEQNQTTEKASSVGEESGTIKDKSSLSSIVDSAKSGTITTLSLPTAEQQQSSTSAVRETEQSETMNKSGTSTAVRVADKSGTITMLSLTTAGQEQSSTSTAVRETEQSGTTNKSGTSTAVRVTGKSGTITMLSLTTAGQEQSSTSTAVRETEQSGTMNKSATSTAGRVTGKSGTTKKLPTSTTAEPSLASAHSATAVASIEADDTETSAVHTTGADGLLSKYASKVGRKLKSTSGTSLIRSSVHGMTRHTVSRTASSSDLTSTAAPVWPKEDTKDEVVQSTTYVQSASTSKRATSAVRTTGVDDKDDYHVIHPHPEKEGRPEAKGKPAAEGDKEEVMPYVVYVILLLLVAVLFVVCLILCLSLIVYCRFHRPTRAAPPLCRGGHGNKRPLTIVKVPSSLAGEQRTPLQGAPQAIAISVQPSGHQSVVVRPGATSPSQLPEVRVVPVNSSGELDVLVGGGGSEEDGHRSADSSTASSSISATHGRGTSTTAQPKTPKSLCGAVKHHPYYTLSTSSVEADRGQPLRC